MWLFGFICGIAFLLSVFVVMEYFFPETTDVKEYDEAIEKYLEEEDYRTVAELKIIRDRLHKKFKEGYHGQHDIEIK